MFRRKRWNNRKDRRPFLGNPAHHKSCKDETVADMVMEIPCWLGLSFGPTIKDYRIRIEADV